MTSAKRSPIRRYAPRLPLVQVEGVAGLCGPSIFSPTLGGSASIPWGHLVKEGLALSNVDIAIIWATLFWGFALGDVCPREAGGSLRTAPLGDAGGSADRRIQLGHQFCHVAPFTMAIPLGLGRVRQRRLLGPGDEHDLPVVAPQPSAGMALGIVGTCIGRRDAA